jgi:hypothetical protein
LEFKPQTKQRQSFEVLGLDTRRSQKQSSRQRARLTPLLDASQAGAVMPGLREGLATSLGLGIKQIPRTTQKQKTVLKLMNENVFDFGLTPPRIPRKFGFGFGLPLPGLGFAGSSKGRKKAKRKLKRQPSLIAAELGITAPRPVRGEKTGLVIRPVTV